MYFFISVIKEIILNGLGEVYDIVVEWEFLFIYWIDYLYEIIEVVCIDGFYRKIFFWENVVNLWVIVVDFWNG